MAKLLQEEGVIAHPRLFRVALMIDPSPKPIKAGEYEVPAHTSMQALVELLQSGKVVQRRLTIPEGMTTPEVLELVRKTEALTGEITLDVKEGDLLPETYFYSRDDTRDGLLLRMKEAMEKTLDEAWRKRAAGLPLANKREALILASMIEKETAVPAERTKVAAVFINRLRRRMKLESDPTTIYGLTEGKVPLGRDLTRADLQSNTPFNTYVIAGPAARADLQSGPRLDRGGDQSGARPLALFRRRRAGRARLRHHASRAQSQRRALAPDPARAGGIPISSSPRPSSRKRRRHRRRPLGNRAVPAVALLALLVLAGIALVVAWFLRANPSSLARVLRVIMVDAGRHRRGRPVDLRPAFPAGSLARTDGTGGHASSPR